MDFFRNKRQMSLLLTLQQAYEDAYQGSVHAIVLETRNEHVEALHAWKATLRKISLNLASVTETPQSSQEIDLMTNIMNVEKQCHDRIAFLERGWTDTNPYASYMTNSDDYISSQISNHYHHTSSTSTSNQSPYVPDHYSNPSFVDLSSSNYHQFQNATASSPPPIPPKVSLEPTYNNPPNPPPHLSDYQSRLDPRLGQYEPEYSVPQPPPSTTFVTPVARASPKRRPTPSSDAISKDVNALLLKKSFEFNETSNHNTNSSLSNDTSSSRTNSSPSVQPKFTHSSPAIASVPNRTSTPPKASSASSLSHKPSSPSTPTNLSVDQQFATLKLVSGRSLSPFKEQKEQKDRESPQPRAMLMTLRTSNKTPKKVIDERRTASDAAHLAWTPSPRTMSTPAPRTSSSPAPRAPAQKPAPKKPMYTQPRLFKTPVIHAPVIKTAAQAKKSAPTVAPSASRNIPNKAVSSTPKSAAVKASGQPVYKTNRFIVEKKSTTNTLPKHVTKKSPAKPIAAKSNRTSSSASKSNGVVAKRNAGSQPPTPDLSDKQDTPSSSTATSDVSDGDNDELTEEEAWLNKARAIVKKIKGIDQNAADSIFNDVVVKGDPVVWDDIAGLEQAKSSLKEAVVYPFLRPDLFSGLREPAQGMLLFGPPGTGKTMLARAVATESKSTFFSISASSLTSKFLGESEKLVRALFLMAKALAPAIIFVDEIDSLMSARSDTGEHESSRRIKTEFLIQWSALQHAAAGKEHDDVTRVLVLGATNLPWVIDEAARRRFVRRQYIPLPEPETRRHHLKKLLSRQKHSLSDAQMEQLVRLTDGFSGSDLTALAKDAAMGPLRALGEALLTTPTDQIRPLGFEDFEAALKTIRPSVSKESLKVFEDWAAMYGSSGA